MKNILITLLVIAVFILGYILVIKEDLPATNTGNDSISTTQSENPSDASSDNTINLSSSELIEVPKDILGNSPVTTIDVSNNNLTGSLPGEIRKLTNLEVLNASDNKMTGIPAEIGQLSKLITANFANNNLSGLPLEIGNLSNLETLDLRGNPNISTNDIALIQKEIPNAQILTN